MWCWNILKPQMCSVWCGFIGTAALYQHSDNSRMMALVIHSNKHVNNTLWFSPFIVAIKNNINSTLDCV